MPLSATPLLALTVRSGPARGAHAALGAGRHVLAGAAAETTETPAVTLVDAGAAAAAVTLHWRRRAEIELLSGEGALGGRPLALGAPMRLSRRETLRLGEAELTLQARAGAPRKLAAAAVFTAAALAVLTAPAPKDFAASSAIIALPAPAPRSIDAEAAAADLRGRLQAENLSTVQVRAIPEAATVSVRGPIGMNEDSRWRAARDGFDAKWAGAVGLDARFDETEADIVLPFEIRAIWMTPEPMLITDDGARRWVGDLLPGGWRLTAIAADGAAIARDGVVIDIQL